NSYKADLHIHTVLSPCADLEMTPCNIVEQAKKTGIEIIGITDHNSTKNALLVKRLAEKEKIYVLTGAEVTTKEEVHCLAFFEFDDQLNQFQQFLDEQITIIPNPDGHFGYQPVVDENDNILELIPNYLPAALKSGIQEVQQKVESLNGIFIPAHVDRPSNGLFSQLGFIPRGLKFDAMGISRFSSEKDARKHYVLGNEITLIRNSDAHYLQQIGEICTMFWMEGMNFLEIKMALNQQRNRFVEVK
ncbi:MAG TPA: PHP domain-containing protein, partial [Draconibacterium sp.]|nr:PHP domain-containing protein [Draconibacterium sp.]